MKNGTIHFGWIMLILVLSSACNNRTEGVKQIIGYLGVAVRHLENEDTAKWEVHQSWDLTDSTKLLIAKTKYYFTGHSGGPELSMLLLKKIGDEWQVLESKLHLPIITSWGQTPTFRLESFERYHLLSVDYGFGSQGNDHRILKFFDVDKCHFGETSLIYAYEGRIVETVAASIVKDYVDIRQPAVDFVTRLYIQEINYQINPKTENILIYSKEHYFSIYPNMGISDTTLIQKVNLPQVDEEYKRILCSWGRSAR